MKISKETHGNKYDYSLSNYNGSRRKIKIICDKGHIFEQIADNHMSGANCPKCSNCISKKEVKWLDSLNIKEENRQYKIGRYIVDGFDFTTNTVYEFNGDYWHGNPAIYNLEDVNKTSKKTFGELYQYTLDKENKLKDLGYNVISIWESDFVN